MATLKIEINGKEYEESSSGDGQYDAFVRALRKIYKAVSYTHLYICAELILYQRLKQIESMKTKVLLAAVAVAFPFAVTSCGNKKAACLLYTSRCV